MKSELTSKVTFTLLDKIPMRQASKLAMGQSFNLVNFQRQKKQICSTIYLIQISYWNQQWVLLKTDLQCQQLLTIMYESNVQSNKIVKKIQGLITNILPFAHKNQFPDLKLIEYLNSIGQKPNALQNQNFAEFIQYKNVFERYVYRKFTMIKKNGGRYKQGCCSIGSIWTQWKKRQVSVQYNGITYKNQFGQIKQYLPFSHGFQYFFGKEQTGLRLGVILVSNHRRLVLQNQSIQDHIIFLYLLKKKTMESPYLSINRFNSFAPSRQLICSDYYIDGKQYFDAVYQGISRAKKSIYMTGWMISPEFLITRVPQNVSLFDAIKQKVKAGVQVNILVYHQSTFISNDSAWAKQKFESLGHKVKVIRHPTGKLPILWSHHSKMVIIDKEQAFFGGLDLCYGRYDCNLHEIFPEKAKQLYPGIEYNNCRIKDIDNVRKFTIDHIDKRQPRLPWHDICQSVKGTIVNDFVHHFVQIWNFASYENRQVLNKEIINVPTQMQMKSIHNIISTKDSEVQMGDESNQNNKNNKIIAALSNKLQQVKNKGKQSLSVWKQMLYPQKKRGLEQLYRKKKIYAAENNFQNYIAEIQKQLSTIYQEQESRLQRKQYQPPKNQAKRPIILKRNSLIAGDLTKDSKQLQVDEDYMDNLKKLEIKSEEVVLQMDEDIDSEQQGPAKIWQNKPYQSQLSKEGTSQCQLLRSVGNWSIGCSVQKSQFSIHIAYLQLISQAKYYIYIQNQFFISSTPQTKQVKNQIVNALFRRIKVAVQKKQQFKVYVMLPLLPAFAGDIEGDNCTFLRMIMDWQYKTIRGLISKIQNLGVDPNKHIQFLGLRTHGTNCQGDPTTQIIYVHSKIMIIDDTATIIGSANINDRSLLGDRDSQIAVVTYGTDIVQGIMGGQKAKVSKRIKQFRTRLWRQHYQFDSDTLQDPISSILWQKIQFVSKNNTEIYRCLFGCYPDSKMKTLHELKEVKEKSSLQNYYEQTKYIYGNVTQYPYEFLSDEPLQGGVMSKESLLPTECLV